MYSNEIIRRIVAVVATICSCLHFSTAFTIKPKTTTITTTTITIRSRSIGSRTITNDNKISNNNRHNTVQLLSSATSSSSSSTSSVIDVPEGLIKSITKQGYGRLVRLGDVATVKYTCYLASDDDNNDNDNNTVNSIPLARSSNQKFVIGDGTMIDGWDKALRTMNIGERSIVRIIDPKLAYGSVGYGQFIPPNSIIEMDIEVLDSVPVSTNIDFDSLAAKADRTPSTAKDIAAAFERKQRQRALSTEPVLEGFDAFIAKVKNFYFYGLFEGETGERPPWFLRPSITFPLAFAIVGAAFYISLAGGAISERGAQSKDELDEIILISSSLIYFLK